MQQKESSNEVKLDNLSNKITNLEKELDEYKAINSKEIEFKNKQFNDLKISIDKIINDSNIDNKIENIATNTTTSIVDQYLA
jgi:hypothetical protein